MKRTTLLLEDGVFGELRHRAVREGRSLKDLVNDLLRQALAPRKTGKYKFDFPVFKGGKGLRPGVNLEDRQALMDIMDGR